MPPVELLDQIKATARGAFILKDWLGAGGRPVDERHATLRAAICVHCPHNERGNWWDSVKTAIAGSIRQNLAVKRSLKIETPFDDRLGTCSVCKCNNPLQVWVPISHVAVHTSPETTKQFPWACWKHIELTS